MKFERNKLRFDELLCDANQSNSITFIFEFILSAIDLMNGNDPSK